MHLVNYGNATIMITQRIKLCRGRSCDIRRSCMRYALYQEHGERASMLLEAYDFKKANCKFKMTVKL